VLLAWTWGTWPDVLVDFGRELYVPWQLAQGKRVYTDIAYFNGPLSLYFNTLVFHVFGIGLSTLVWVNVALVAAILALLHYAALCRDDRRGDGRVHCRDRAVRFRSARRHRQRHRQPTKHRGADEREKRCACVCSVRSNPTGANKYGEWKTSASVWRAIRIHQKFQRLIALSPIPGPSRCVDMCLASGHV
jgi:hypothetical protein